MEEIKGTLEITSDLEIMKTTTAPFPSCQQEEFQSTISVGFTDNKELGGIRVMVTVVDANGTGSTAFLDLNAAMMVLQKLYETVTKAGNFQTVPPGETVQ